MIHPTHRYCATRALKNARFIQAHAPNLIPAREPEEGFASVIPFSQLCRLHVTADQRSLPEDLRAVTSALPWPEIATTAQTPLFKGTLYVTRITFAIDGASGTSLAVTAADVTTAIRYLGLACPPISAYASAYGSNALRVSPTALEYAVTLPASSYNDQTLQGWIGDIVSQNGLDAAGSCIVVLSPQGVVNTDADSTQGILGYHGIAKVPYCFANVFGQGFAVDDAADVFAWQLSHEVAEMTVDPTANQANPEVCDPVRAKLSSELALFLRCRRLSRHG